MQAKITPILSSDDSDAIISSHDATDLSPIQLIKHLAVYGPRDSTFVDLKHSGIRYRTTRGFIVNFFAMEDVRRDNTVKDALVLVFDDDRNRYRCEWCDGEVQIELLSDTITPIAIDVDMIHDPPNDV